MEKDLLKGWKDISQVYIPPLETHGFTENVLQRSIWDIQQPLEEEQQEEVLQEQENSSETEDATVLLTEEEEELQEDDVTRILPLTEPQEKAYLIRKDTNERIDLTADYFVVGKGKQADYQIQGNDAISRKHIAITKTEDGYQLEDLGSSNHTYINDRQLEAPVPLMKNQSFKMANEEFTFYIELV